MTPSPHDYVLTLLASHLMSFGVPLATLGMPLGSYWMSCTVLSAVLGYLWDPFGHLGLGSAVF